ncbi:hypothetical protein ONZ45_g6653 [Pleurotus djamor]|nr:hypothetical protein ONZ45_g6653 [Pleurotus djamor]
MASSAVAQSTPTATSNPSASRWGSKNSESAFGPGRGRGRGGSRGSGRGGRGGGRGGFRGGKSQADVGIDKSDAAPSKTGSPVTEKTSSLVAAKSSPAQSISDTQSSASRSKPPSRRASRATPALVIAASPSVDSSTSGRSPKDTRRKRSGTNNGKSPSSAGPKSSVSSIDESQLRPGSKGRIPVMKDVPPHLRQSQTVKTDIDALVERVRASAMADNRPSTPGTASHIDWAGEDDDTLPDLDDWGVTTVPARSDKHNEISPIFVDGLRPLPEPMAFPIEPQETPHFVPPEIPLQTPQEVPEVKPVSKDHSPIFSKASIEPEPSPTPAEPAVAIPSSRKKITPNQVKELARGASKKTTRHPLPPKPIAIVDPPLSSSKQPPSATPMRKFAKTSPQSKATKTFDTVTVQPPTPQSELDQPIVKLPEQGLEQSMHAPSPNGSSDTKIEQSPETGSDSTKVGDESLPNLNENPSKSDVSLSASIHAPKPGESLSAPGSATFDSFKPTHMRAHTTGRPLNNTSHRFPRSAATSPRSSFTPHHARNHSTPPPGSAHRMHASRPVITGDAISRLARTIGTSMTPSKSQPASISKD